MTLTEIYPTIEALPQADKLQLLHWLAADVATEQRLTQSLAGKTIPLWSPHDSFEGAAVLHQLLEQQDDAS